MIGGHRSFSALRGAENRSVRGSHRPDSSQGKRAILLVPEILLTENSIERFEKLLDRSHIAVLHSRRPAGERVREWRRIHEGHVWLVIGSRSALFAPVTDLGLVIDEEHEWTYKNEQMPRYHARETAETLARASRKPNCCWERQPLPLNHGHGQRKAAITRRGLKNAIWISHCPT